MNDETSHFVLFGLLILSNIVAMAFGMAVKQFVRKNEPDIWRKFGWSKAPPFLSLRSSPRNTTQNIEFGRWMRREGADYIAGRHPKFRRLWQFSQVTGVLAICLFIANVASLLLQIYMSH